MPAIGASSKFTFSIDGFGGSVDVAQFEAEEAISELYRVTLLLVSEDADIAFDSVIGKLAVLTMTTDGSEPRHLHGIINRFASGESGKKLTTYRATLVPKLWRLHHRHDSRIFQELSVPDIIKKVLEGGGLAAGNDFQLSLEKPHPTREYCVQYRESDLAFISRLMEEEGIFYFFNHTEGSHLMMIADGPGPIEPIAGPASLAFRPPLGAIAHGESVSRFTVAEEIRPGRVTLNDFNFKTPSLALLETSHAKVDGDLEVYDYPGEYEVPGDGQRLAQIRLEELQAVRQVGDGDSGCVRMIPGHAFTLQDHPRDAGNRTYLITRVHHRGGQATLGEADGGSDQSYLNTFHFMPNDVPYRPARQTPRPTIKGVQTAIVVGPSGEEIYTDEFGRVKVQFHWDRLGHRDDKSSCWIRVSQLWAGTAFGGMFIPRVGQEVVVDFIEGDPDRPLVVGRVYHRTNVPPYPLPAEKTKSTIKSNSTPGGGGSNELRFEDRKGREEVYLHAQKDWNIKVEHDKGQEVGHDETLQVLHDRTMGIIHDLTETIGNDQTVTIGKTLSVTVGEDEVRAVSGNRSVAVDKDHDEAVGGNQVVEVTGSQNIAVGKDKTEAISGSSTASVTKDLSVSVNENFTLNVSKDGSVSFSKNAAENVGEKKAVVVGKELSITVGNATIQIKSNGDVAVQGKKITVKGTGPIEVQGAKIQVKSDGDVKVEASGSVTVKGATVGVN